MKTAISLASIATGVLLSASLLVPTAARAGDADGMKCPSGYTAAFSNGVLKCSKQITTNVEVRKSVCPIIPFVGTTYEQRTNAADVCRRSDNGALVATVPEFAFDPQNWRRDVDGSTGALDRFVKGGQTQTDFVWPVPVNGLYGV
jgi:hypothetical protein